MIAVPLLLSLFVVVVCPRKSGRYAHTPAAPKLNKITSIGGPPFKIGVEWEPVKFYDRSRNSGYKVKMWESEKVLVKFKVGKVWNKKYVSEQSLHTMPRKAPVEQIVEVCKTKAIFEGIKPDVYYQIRVQAFDQLRHGPYSNVLAIKLLTRAGGGKLCQQQDAEYLKDPLNAIVLCFGVEKTLEQDLLGYLDKSLAQFHQQPPRSRNKHLTCLRMVKGGVELPRAPGSAYQGTPQYSVLLPAPDGRDQRKTSAARPWSTSRYTRHPC